MTLEGYDRAEHILLSYDVSGLARHQAARACHIVFGRRRRDGSKGDRIEPGFIHRPGVVWIGQSVLAMPPWDADELAGRLWPPGLPPSGPLGAVRVNMFARVAGGTRFDVRRQGAPWRQHSYHQSAAVSRVLGKLVYHGADIGPSDWR